MANIRIKASWLIILAILLLFSLISCKKADLVGVQKEGEICTSFYDVPGITQEEIKAIEALKNQYKSFVYGMPLNCEAFEDENGELRGFSALFCQWLQEFFEIPFELRLYEWSEIFSGLASGEIDFSGELTVTEERKKNYYQSGDIASRPLKYYTLANNRPHEDIIRERPLRCGFIRGTTSINIVVPELVPGTFEIILLDDMSLVYDALINNEIDAFYYSSAAEAYFINHTDMVSEYFYPLNFLTVSFSTQKPELKHIVSVVDKVLKHDGLQYFVSLYNQGEQEYLRYKLYMQLTEEEQEYLNNNSIVKIGINPGSYPGSFYDKREHSWDGIYIDILKELTLLTGLTFERVNDEHASWAQIYKMVEDGEISFVPELMQSPDRMDRFIWPDTSQMTDYYALISSSDYRNLKINEVLYAKIGLVRDSAHAAIFYKWFPNHASTVLYYNMEDAFRGLQRGEVEMVMTNQMRLLYLTHYLEQPGYKANIVFNYPMDIKFGLNKNEEVLCSIINKALNMIETEEIANRWMRKTYDYRTKMAEAQRPLLFGVVIMIIIVSLLAIFLIKRKSAFDTAMAADKAKSTFLANMSHEIRTPMNSILGFSELAMDDDISPKTKDYLVKIRKNVEWLLQIVNDILDLSKIESGKMELEKIPFDMSEMIESCRMLIVPKAEEKGLVLHFYIEPMIEKIPLGDPTRLRQVFVNLLSNAIKFTKTGTIKLYSNIINQTENTITINFEVIDSGIGMTPEQIKKIFDPFKQAETGTTRKYGGTGLGLTITKNIIEMMGGRLCVESTSGIGTKFSFELTFDTVSIDDEERPETKAALQQIQKPKFNGEVLVCEDNNMNQQVICEHLARVGLKTVIAENGKIGLNMVQERNDKGQKQFDLIFMDMHMPVMDGHEAAAKIMKLNTGVPIVAMTANVMSSDKEIYEKNGMNDCIGKPFTSQELWRCLRKYFKPVYQASELMEMEKEFLVNLKHMFLDSNKNKHEEIIKAMEDGDIKLVFRIVHTLKSNAGQIGKTALQKASAVVEAQLKNGVNNVAPEQLNALEIELKIAISELENELKS